ncbi:MAG: hypothetical protein QMD14_02650 [Candidatus Aenigmarchaeota archaeon]|nr:hypothetical protein [Candidatus Aenigmarchaeota archaeon]
MPGICAACKNFSQALVTCKACGATVCPRCIEPSGFCRLCKGRRFI